MTGGSHSRGPPVSGRVQGRRQARGGWAAAWLVRGRTGPEALAAHAARERGGGEGSWAGEEWDGP